MMLKILIVIAAGVILAGCTPTAEVLKAQRVNQERLHYYSMQAGDYYRYPASDVPSMESPRAMPKFSALSYSPLRIEPTIVKVPKGRIAPAFPSRGPAFSSGWVYSPLTGEAVKITPR